MRRFVTDQLIDSVSNPRQAAGVFDFLIFFQLEESCFVHYLCLMIQRQSTSPFGMNIPPRMELHRQSNEARDMAKAWQQTVPLLEGRSTSGVIEAIVKLYCPDAAGGKG